jgi:glycosyltransferase involved in cell wall biosynthesis
MRVLFVIRSLHVGGAERQLLALARGLADRGHAVRIAAMYSDGAMRRELANQDRVTLLQLDKSGRFDVFGFFSRAIRATREFDPDVVHGYMSGANEVASILATASGAKSVWGVRVSDQSFTDYSLFRRGVFSLGNRAARFADLIIANSGAGKRTHVSYGYPESRTIVIPNGIDSEKFKPASEDAIAWRKEIGLTDEPLIVLPARLDPMKGHDTFVRAASILVRSHPNAKFVLVGPADSAVRERILRQIEASELSSSVFLRGSEADMNKVYSAADIVTLTSKFGEGFPNVLGEAMACARPCVSTDVGDAAEVIGDRSYISPIGDAADLADRWGRILSLDAAARHSIGVRNRARVIEEFSVSRLIDRSESAIKGLLQHH